MSIIRALVIAACIGLGLPALAEDVIVVTATRGEQSLQDVIVPMTVINRQQIEQAAASDIAELLRFEAGLDIGRNGGPGQATSVFLRGTESNHTLVLVDGVRVNPGTIGGAALQNIAPEVIERIEIVKGGRSSLYGTDAIGGVINVITRRAGSGYAEAGAGGGSFDTRSAYFSAGQETANGEFGATLNWQDTAGYAIRSDSNSVRGYDNLSANLYASHQLGALTAELRHWQSSGRNEYLDFLLAPLSQDYHNESTALELSNPVGNAAHSRLLLAYMTDDIEQNDAEDYVVSRRLSLDWQYSVALERHDIAAGVYATRENAEALSFGSGFDEDTDTKALFLQDTFSLGRHRSFASARYTDHETFGSEFTWNAEYAFDVTERVSINAGLGHAFRAPDATDRFGFGGNPDLFPETSDQQQLGARFDVSPRHSLQLELYRNNIDDLIEFDIASFTLQNISEAEIRGAQLGWQFNGEVYSLRTDAVLQTAENAADGSKLLRRPERSLTVNLQRSIGAHRLGLSLLANDKREDVSSTLPGYVLLNVTGQFRLAANWQMNVRVENLLDKYYETAAPYRMPERSVFAEIKYRWH